MQKALQFQCGECGSRVVIVVDPASTDSVAVTCPDPNCQWNGTVPSSTGVPLFDDE